MRRTSFSALALFIFSLGGVVAAPCETCQKTLESRDANNIAQRRLDVLNDDSRPVIKDEGTTKGTESQTDSENDKHETEDRPPQPAPYEKPPAEHEELSKRSSSEQGPANSGEEEVKSKGEDSRSKKRDAGKPPEPPTNKLLHPH